VHVPKNGGVTMEIEFKLVDNRDSHSHYEVLAAKYPDYQFHAIVRNPYDRFISAYYFLELFDRRNPNKARYGKWKDRGLLGSIKFLVSKPTERVTAVLRPQHFFVCDDKGDICCNIYKYENFYDTYLKFCNILDVTPKDYLFRHNEGEHDFYRDYYNKELQELVYEYYKKDFELFNYSKKL